MTAHAYDIRVLAPAGIEDHHAHLLRLDYLDRCLFFSAGNDDRAVDSHCLRLLSAQAIVIGAYDGAKLRASVEIVPDRSGRCGRATLIAEKDVQSDSLADALFARAQDEARKHGLSQLDVVGMTGTPQTMRTQMARFA
jgi:hypothetical protein